MNTMTLGRRLILVAATLALTAAAPLKQGDPIPSIDVILDGDPSGLTVSGTTDRSGVALFSAQPGRYALMLPNAETVRVPAVARVEVGRSVLTSNTIQPGGRGNAYFTGRDGRRLSIMVPRGARVRIVLTEGAPVAGGGQSRGGTLPPVFVPDEDGVLVQGLRPGGGSGPVRRLPELPPRSTTVSPSDFDGDGRMDNRTNPGAPIPTTPGV